MADSIAKLKAAGAKVPSSQVALLDDLSATIESSRSPPPSLCDAIDEHAAGDTLAHAKYMHDTIIPGMAAVRAAADKLEAMVAADLWPLPTYQEMLFIK